MAKAIGLLLGITGVAGLAIALVMAISIGTDRSSPGEQPGEEVARSEAPSRVDPEPESLPVRAAVPKVESAPAPEVATVVQRPVEAATRMPETSLRTPAPRLDRASLVRELQRELKRVGCYDGILSGEWTPATRAAMKAFTDRVNAALPTDAPDVILLTLVQDHQEKACGVGCPAGQTLAADGRCLPTGVLAARKTPQAPRTGAPPPPTAQPAITGWSSVRTMEARPPAEALAQPMGLAGPPAAQAPAAVPAPAPALAATPAAPRPAPTQRGPARVSDFGPGAFRQFEGNRF